MSVHSTWLTRRLRIVLYFNSKNTCSSLHTSFDFPPLLSFTAETYNALQTYAVSTFQREAETLYENLLVEYKNPYN